MSWDFERKQRRSSVAPGRAPRVRQRAALPEVESLEGRQLLSIYTGPTSSRPIVSHGTVFTLSVTGGGYETVKRMRHGLYAINLYATNASSALSISAQSRQTVYNNVPLPIGQINIKTGLLGSINAGAGTLLGRMTPIQGSLSSLIFNAIGPNARVDVEGSVGDMETGGVTVGPTGHVNIAGDITGQVAGGWTINGGQFNIGGDVTGSLSPGGLTVEHGGILSVGHNLTGGMNVAGTIAVSTNGQISIGNNLGGLTVGQDLDLNTGGSFLVGGDVTAASTVNGSLQINQGGLFAVKRDFLTGLTVGGDMTLDSAGNFNIGRDLAALNVGGNLQVAPAAGQVRVGGNLDTLKITGAYQGKGLPTSTDLVVGLDLNDVTVDGGGANQGGIQDANIDVGKGINGLTILHGIFNSLITAGVLIDGTGGTSGVGNGTGTVGADGIDAVFNSQLLAGVDIYNLTLSGDVKSDFPTNPNPTGYPTRILAGANRDGTFNSGGLIDNFQITGALIDSVLAASVAPSGGNGTLPPSGYTSQPARTNTPGDGGSDTYDAPNGLIYGGPVSAPVAYPNWSEITYFNETFQKLSWNHQLDPTIDDYILPGAINPSFASAPLTASQLQNPTVTSTYTSNTSGPAGSTNSSQTTTSSGGGQTTTSSINGPGGSISSTSSSTITGTTTLNLPLPSKSTVLGGVISTQHGDAQDYASILAADTSGVFVGTLPKQ